MSRSTEAWLTSSPTPHESREPPLLRPKGPRPPAPQGVGVWPEPHAKPRAPSGSPASADRDVGDGRRPRTLTLALLALPLPAPTPPLPGWPPTAHPLLGQPRWGPSLAMEPPTSAAEPNPPAATARSRRRQRTACRGWRQDGRLVEVRGDGAAYGHARSARDIGDSTPGRTVDDGTSWPTDVDERIRSPSERRPGLGLSITQRCWSDGMALREQMEVNRRL